MSAPAKLSVCAILAAAGIGTRLREGTEELAKQFLELAGKPIYQWPLLVLSRKPEIDRIVVVTLAEMVSKIACQVADLGLSGKVSVIAGGVTRQESVRLGLEALARLDPAPDIVLVHDAARPFLTSEIVDATISAARAHGACTACVPASDTIKRVEDDLVVETLDRESLVLVQTPQAARFDWLMAAHEKAVAQGLATTDDAALLEAAGYPVAVVAGSPSNLKITERHDLAVAEALAGFLEG